MRPVLDSVLKYVEPDEQQRKILLAMIDKLSSEFPDIPKELIGGAATVNGKEVVFWPRGWAPSTKMILDLRHKGPQVEIYLNEDKLDERASYQMPFIHEALKEEEGIITSPTGSGKTVMEVIIITKLQRRSLIVVNTGEILDQTRETIKRLIGIEAGMIGQGIRDVRPVTVALFQSLKEDDPILKDIGLLLIDECFSGETRITLSDGSEKSISELWATGTHTHGIIGSCGDVVRIGSSTRIWRRKNFKPMCRLTFEDGRVLRVTFDHKIYTPNGIKRAKELVEGESVLALRKAIYARPIAFPSPSVDPEKTDIQMPVLRFGVLSSQRGGPPRKEGARNSMLILREEISRKERPPQPSNERSWNGADCSEKKRHPKMASPPISFKDGGEEPRLRNGSCGRVDHGSEFMDQETPIASSLQVQSPVEIESLCISSNKEQGAKAEQGRDEALTAASEKGPELRPIYRGFYVLGNGKGQEKEPRLHCNRTEEGHRTLRRILPQAKRGDINQEILRKERMESPDCVGQSPEESRGSDEKTDLVHLRLTSKVCEPPDEWVYDLTQLPDHNLFANGVLAANCHHISATSYLKILRACPAYYRYGLTATIKKTDKSQRVIHAVIGKHIADIPVKELQAKGFLNAGEYRAIYTTALASYVQFIGERCWYYKAAQKEDAEKKCPAVCTYPKDDGIEKCVYGRAYFGWIYDKLAEDIIRNNQLLKVIVEATERYPAVVVLTHRKKHMDFLATELPKRTQQPIWRACGPPKMKVKERREQVANYRKHGGVLVATTGAIGEGFDAPNTGCLVRAMPSGGMVSVKQHTGRIMRPQAKKSLIIDLVDRKIPRLKGWWFGRQSIYKTIGFTPEQKKHEPGLFA